MAYCSRSEVKSYAGITGSTEAVDTLIKDLCDRVSTTIETYCNRVFDPTEHTEYQDGYGDDTFITNHYPITSVSGIYEDTSRSFGDITTVNPTDYFIMNDRVIQRKIGNFINYTAAIKIVYTAGYATIPNDIKHVAIIETARAYKDRNEIGVKAKSLGDGTISYVDEDLLPQSKLILDKYMRKDIV